MLPFPNHLKNILVPKEEINERTLVSYLRCQCGGDEFQILYSGETDKFQEEEWPCSIEINGHYIFIIEAICNKCKEKHLLFDSDFHGWDGVMCHDPQKANLPRPQLVPWKCLSCKNLTHKIEIKIDYETKDNFIEQSRGEFDIDKWPDAFEWITISIECTQCHKKTDKWVDYETM
jgi:hypothetical protein